MSIIAATLRETGESTRLVFTNPNLRRVNLALAGSMIGDWAYSTAIAVWIYRFGGAPAVAAFAVVRLALMAVGLPFLTVLVDKLPHKPFLIACDLIRLVLVLAAAGLIWSGGPPLAVIVLAVLVGLVSGPFRPAQTAMLPRLARQPQELTAANAVSSTLESVAFFAGPALAGLLLAVTTVPVILVLNAVSFGWSAMLIARIALPERAPGESGSRDAGPQSGSAEQGRGEVDEPAPSGFLREVTAGFRVIRADSRLGLVTVLVCAQTLVAGAAAVFTLVIAFDVVRLGEPGVGYLNAVLGVGAILGGLFALSRASRGSVAQDFAVGIAGWALPPLLVSVWPTPWMAFLAFALIGFANPLVDVNFVTLVQRVAPEAVLGRVFGALESVLIASMAIGAALFPVLLSLIGLRWALVVLCLPVAVVVGLALPAFRRIDRTVAGPPHLDLIRALRAVPAAGPVAPGGAGAQARGPAGAGRDPADPGGRAR